MGRHDAGTENATARTDCDLHQPIGATFGLGATTGPLLMTALITRGASWRWGYAVIAVMMAALAVTFVVTHRVWENGDASAVSGGVDAREADRVSTLDLLRLPRVWAGICRAA